MAHSKQSPVSVRQTVDDCVIITDVTTQAPSKHAHMMTVIARALVRGPHCIGCATLGDSIMEQT